jgi:hypothetical protein
VAFASKAGSQPLGRIASWVSSPRRSAEAIKTGPTSHPEPPTLNTELSPSPTGGGEPLKTMLALFAALALCALALQTAFAGAIAPLTRPIR